jgi:hypothetical protein
MSFDTASFDHLALAAFRKRGALSGSLPPDTAVWGLSSDALPVWRPRDHKTDRDPDALPFIDVVPVFKNRTSCGPEIPRADLLNLISP